MPEGKFFLIRSNLNPDLCLDIEAGASDPGTRVLTYGVHGGDNQLWYVDHMTGTIRSKLNNMCLDLAGNRLIINPHNPDEDSQRWDCRGEQVCQGTDPNKVLDVVAGCSDECTEICCWDMHGGDNQSWKFEHTEATFFFIESRLNGKVLDVAGADPAPGARVITWHKKDGAEDNQLWYEDKHGVIKSKLSDLILDGTQDPMTTGDFNPGEARHWWLVGGDKIVNKHNHGEVIDIRAANEDDGAEIIPYEVHGGNNQLWDFVPA